MPSFYLLDCIIDYFQDLQKFSLMQMFLALRQKIWQYLMLAGKFLRGNLTEDKMLSEFRILQNLIWRSSFWSYFIIGLFLSFKVLFSFRLQSVHFLFHFSWLIMIFNSTIKQRSLNSLHCYLISKFLFLFCLCRNKILILTQV